MNHVRNKHFAKRDAAGGRNCIFVLNLQARYYFPMLNGISPLLSLFAPVPVSCFLLFYPFIFFFFSLFVLCLFCNPLPFFVFFFVLFSSSSSSSSSPSSSSSSSSSFYHHHHHRLPSSFSSSSFLLYPLPPFLLPLPFPPAWCTWPVWSNEACSMRSWHRACRRASRACVRSRYTVSAQAVTNTEWLMCALASMSENRVGTTSVSTHACSGGGARGSRRSVGSANSRSTWWVGRLIKQGGGITKKEEKQEEKETKKKKKKSGTQY